MKRNEILEKLQAKNYTTISLLRSQLAADGVDRKISELVLDKKAEAITTHRVSVFSAVKILFTELTKEHSASGQLVAPAEDLSYASRQEKRMIASKNFTGGELYICVKVVTELIKALHVAK